MRCTLQMLHFDIDKMVYLSLFVSSNILNTDRETYGLTPRLKTSCRTRLHGEYFFILKQRRNPVFHPLDDKLLKVFGLQK